MKIKPQKINSVVDHLSLKSQKKKTHHLNLSYLASKKLQFSILKSLSDIEKNITILQEFRDTRTEKIEQN